MIDPMNIKVFGHQSPDTDTTVSAMVWSWYLNHYRQQTATPYVLGKVNKEVEFVLDYWGFEVPVILDSVCADDQIAIVDTNNIDELFPNVNEATIVSIIDHHKLTGGLKTNSPQEIIIQPVASTITVMFTLMNLEVNEIPKNIAGLMLSGVVSDTLNLQSPTTTEADRDLAIDLAEQLELDLEIYSQQMFEAKSDVSDLSAGEIITLDSKVVEVGKDKIRFSVLETTNPERLLGRKQELVDSIVTHLENSEESELLFFIVDIIKQQSTLITYNNRSKELSEQAFGVIIEGDELMLPGVISRKKQIIPAYLK